MTIVAAPSDAAGFNPPSPAAYPHQRDIHAYLSTEVLSRRNEYLQQKKIKIKVASWNVAACDGTERDLEEWLLDYQNDFKSEGDEDAGGVGIYVLALQEVVDVTVTENFIKYMDPKVSLKWEAHAQVYFLIVHYGDLSHNLWGGNGVFLFRRRCRLAISAELRSSLLACCSWFSYRQTCRPLSLRSRQRQ